MVSKESVIFPLQRTLVAAAVVLLVGGCTEERAIALKTAAEVFAQKAGAAIDEVVELHLRAAIGRPEAEEARIKGSKKDLIETQKKKPAALGAVIADTFRWVNERERLRRESFADYDKLKTAYQEFAAAYRRLPEGSFVAAKDVACSAALGARLTKYMADAGKALAANPPPLAWELPISEKAVEAGAIGAAKTQNDGPLDDAVRAHVALLRDRDSANARAVAMLADAAEAGAETVELIERYDDVSAADILKAMRRVLVLRESTFGLSSKSQLERLDSIVSKLGSKPALAKALHAPLNQTLDECK